MKTIDLGGIWRMTGGGWDVDAAVPGTVVSALLAAGKIPEPYLGSNEAAVQPIFDHDYTFSRTFTLARAQLSGWDRAFLRCDGLDTVCTLFLNGAELARTDNMHRQYRFDVSDALREGENELRAVFASPVRCWQELDSPMGKAFASLRKAHCMYGWDWGIRLPDSGIWRPISLEFASTARLRDVLVHQEHENGRVRLAVTTEMERFAPGETELTLTVTGPDGACVLEETVPAQARTEQAVTIPEPRLWWPAGYGEQPLYRVCARLTQGGAELDARSFSVGLRTVELYRGEGNVGDYRFSVNGVPIYVKGCNIVIEDAVIPRTTPARWARMVDNAVRANCNALRVWGGAYYPPDEFYELCDRRGVLVYQDFMFACRFYWPGSEFLSNIREEIAQTVVRLRNHPCLCLWCGNNEADFFYTVFTSREEETVAFLKQFGKEPYDEDTARRVRALYRTTFQEVIPEIAARLSPDVGYIHSSPSAGDELGAADMLDYFDKGDSHYYHHANSDAPYRKLGRYRIRFLSEFGFQSYPSLKTLREYLPEEALTPYSPDMLTHQKSVRGNETIELYLSRDFFVPGDFADYVYMSQMMAGEILRYTVEHMRRDRDYSRGVLLWQLNDCWPVVSWAGVDYRGRWKGQQYYTKRFFAPVLASAREEGGAAEIVLVNDRTAPVPGVLSWALYDGRSLAASGSLGVTLPPASTGVYARVDSAGRSRKGLNLSYTFRDTRGAILSRGSLLFAEQNDFAFEAPALRARLWREGSAYYVSLTADCFVKALCLDLSEGDALFSDNFFDLAPGERYTVSIDERDLTGAEGEAGLRAQLTAACVNAVACAAPVHIIWEED